MFVGSRHRFPRALKSRPAILAWALVLIWAVLPFLPESTGLRFSWVYRIFFSAMAVMGVLFFWFLDMKPIPMPRSPATALGGVVLATVVLLVAAGVVYPTYPVPRPATAAATGDVAKGKDVYFNPNLACYRCHMISGKGGVRGPDLTHVDAIAGKRVPGVTAEQYLAAKIEAGALYQYKVPKYTPSMPPYKALLTAVQLRQLVAYMVSLK